MPTTIARETRLALDGYRDQVVAAAKSLIHARSSANKSLLSDFAKYSLLFQAVTSHWDALSAAEKVMADRINNAVEIEREKNTDD